MLIFLLAAIMLPLLWMVYEAGFIKPEYLKYNNGRAGIRIALLSDIHIGRMLVSSRKMKKIIAGASPDLLIIAGDLIDKPSDYERFIKWYKELNPGIPAYATLGNHDYNSFRRNPSIKNVFLFNLSSAGIRVLVNKCEIFEKGGSVISISGLDDSREGNPDFSPAFKCGTNADFRLSVSHNPEIALAMPEGSTDLLLCGHFHGGQIWMPFHLEYKVLRHELVCRMGYRRGLNIINNTPVYISRGLGNVVVPMRLGSRPEITFIDI